MFKYMRYTIALSRTCIINQSSGCGPRATRVMHQPALRPEEEGVRLLDLQVVHRARLVDRGDVGDQPEAAVCLPYLIPNLEVTCPNPVVAQVWVAEGTGPRLAV